MKTKICMMLGMLTWAFSAYAQQPEVVNKGSIGPHLIKAQESDGSPARLGQMMGIVDFGDGDSAVSFVPVFFINDSTLVIGLCPNCDTLATKGDVAGISPDPAMGGDLSGTASNAQIVADAVTATEIAAGAVGNSELATDAVTSDKIIAAAVGTSEIANGSVANADLANMAANTIKGRNNVGTGDPKDLTNVEAATVIMTGLLTIDGAGSGLDADLLDGQQGSYYTNAASVTAEIADTSEVLRALIESAMLVSTSSYAGLATPATNPGTPTFPEFWLTTEAGTYTDFGGLVVTETFAVLSYDTTGAGTWTVSEVDVLGVRAAQIDSAYAYLYGNRIDSVLTKPETFAETTSPSNFWGDSLQYIGDGRIPDSLYYYSNTADTTLISYSTISGSTATSIDVDTVVSVVGLNVVKMDPPALTQKTWVLLRSFNETTRTLLYKSQAGSKGFYTSASGSGGISQGPTLNMGFWVSFHRIVQEGKIEDIDIALETTIPGLQTDVSQLEVDVSQLQSDFASLDLSNVLSPCETDNCIRSRLALYGYAELDTLVLVDTVIYLYEGQELRGLGNAELKVSGSLPGAIVQIEGENAKISGITFSGTNNYDPTLGTQISNQSQALALNLIGTQVGILVDSAKYANISNCHFSDLDRGITGSYAVPGECVVTNCSFEECYIGLDVPVRWEYNSFSNLSMYRCLIGIRYKGGNNNISNVTGRDHRIGMMWQGGDNDSHSSITNSNFNHCFFIGMFLSGLVQQASISNCQIWLTSTNDDLIINNSKMFWVGGYISKNVTYSGTKVCLISNTLFGDTATVSSSVNLKNNWREDGTITGVQN